MEKTLGHWHDATGAMLLGMELSSTACITASAHSRGLAPTSGTAVNERHNATHPVHLQLSPELAAAAGCLDVLTSIERTKTTRNISGVHAPVAGAP